jgi:Cu/Ag efflux pump CusA
MREGVQRRIVVQCNVAGRDLRSTVREIQERVGSAVKLPQGYRIEYGGQFESLERAYQRLTLLGIGGILSLASIVGFITLFGIATRNGIMMISHIRQLQSQGEKDHRAAVLCGAAERLAPILMTALAAGLALVPIALGMGKPGSEIQAPMAIVIFFGLLSSTMLSMVVVPTVYYRFDVSHGS